MKQIGGIWLPDGETHLNAFLENPATQVNGVGTYQKHKLDRALDFCGRFREAVDVGAHVGLWTMHLAARFEHVLAFEPVHEHRQCFAKNTARFSNVTLHPFALGDEIGFVEMEPESAESSGGYHVKTRHGDELVGVPVTRLDYFHFWALDFLKIDVEGFELFVVKGGEDTIRHHRPVICIEQKPPRGPSDRASRFGLEHAEALTLLKSWGANVRAVLSGDYILSW